MIYYTGDIHGDPTPVEEFCHRFDLTEDDTIVILGDVGLNYYGPGSIQDEMAKLRLNKLGPTILCIHGNHEMRPATIPSYKTMRWNGGIVLREDRFPNLLFAVDGEIYTLDHVRHLVIGGAYSVDKFYRIAVGIPWWDDEQPSEEVKRYVERQVGTQSVDIILSHTCPFKYEPREAFLDRIDQSTVDDSTEKWLDKIEEKTDYKAWLCGHWHINKRIDRMHFLKHDFEALDQIVAAP